jgi:hypothetical protein
MRKAVIALVVPAAALVSVACHGASPAGGSATPGPTPGPTLVDVCKTYPCPNAQELTVFDHNRAPIFSVPEYGAVATYGAAFAVKRGVYSTPSVSLNTNGSITLDGVTLTPGMLRFLRRLMARAARQ